MTRPLIILDCNNAAWRNYHALKSSLTWQDVEVGVVYGFLRDVLHLQDRHATDRITLVWDEGAPLRRKILPTYKIKPLQYSNESEVGARKEVYRQMRLLRDEYLPALGFRNQFWAEGFEADDVIARLANDVDGDVIVVSTDRDLWQLLDTRVSIWVPSKGGRMLTWQDFRKEWGLVPADWVHIKALAGCTSDRIPGVVGIGEKTAAAWLRGEVKPDSIKGLKIERNRDLWRFNESLVRLPHPDTPFFDLRSDKVTRRKWLGLLDRLGMESLKKLLPLR